MMSTRCKFVCASVTKNAVYNQPDKFTYNARFTVAYGGSEENKKFFVATPSGQIDLSTYRDDLFIPGKEYYVDITEAVPSVTV